MGSGLAAAGGVVIVMQQPYERRDDHAFGRRVMTAAFVGSIPVWIGLIVAYLLSGPLFAYLVALGMTLPIAWAVIYVYARTSKCPNCGKCIRIDWRTREFTRGGMLRYTCDNCRIEWATHLYPGSDV